MSTMTVYSSSRSFELRIEGQTIARISTGLVNQADAAKDLADRYNTQPALLDALREITAWYDKNHPEHDAVVESWAETLAARGQNPSSETVERELLARARLIIVMTEEA